MPRKKANIHYIYKTTCLITGRYYIGMHSAINLEDGYMGSGKRLRYSIRKHGKENHIKEIIEFFDTRENLIEAEKKAITQEMVQNKICMNLKPGGSGGFCNIEHEKKVHDGLSNWNKKRWLESDFRKKMSTLSSIRMKKKHVNGEIKYGISFLGKKHSKKTKKLISELKQGKGLGETNSQFGTCWITKEGVNKKIKKEEINKYQETGWIKGRKT